MAGECNYGGRITDERDSRVLLALLEEYCSTQASATSPAWHLPPQIASIDDQQAHILSLPLEAQPEIFGLHPNASISKDLQQMRNICTDLNKIGIVEGVGASNKVENPNSSQVSIKVNTVENTESKVKLSCKDMLKKMPAHLFNLDLVRSRYPIDRKNSLNSLLVQEL